MMGQPFLGEDGTFQLQLLVVSMTCSLRDFSVLFTLNINSEVYKMTPLGFRRLDFKAMYIGEAFSNCSG